MAKLVASHILNIPVSEIAVALESTGKPFLRCVSEDNIHLPFISIAHAGETIVFAINEHTPIGVDVELLRTDVDIDDLMQLAFDAIEIQAVNDFDAHCRLRKFYEFWTLKEAFLKATGEGLLTEPNTIVFHIDAKSHARLIKASDEKAKSLWNFYFVQFDESYVIAMAAKNYKIDWCEGPKLIDAARLIQAHCR
ncbi:MAG: 4'-phosphopantetheinyl transferase superfamily protein [Burkholderiales bacterium]|nr:4'-phosphopantetheinyl transferase superfamily protein [Burkholderiales bacterium]